MLGISEQGTGDGDCWRCFGDSVMSGLTSGILVVFLSWLQGVYSSSRHSVHIQRRKSKLVGIRSAEVFPNLDLMSPNNVTWPVLGGGDVRLSGRGGKGAGLRTAWWLVKCLSKEVSDSLEIQPKLV